MNLTPTGFGITVAILLIVAVIVVVADNLRDRREAALDDLYEQDVRDYHCAGHGHAYMEQDGLWLCAHCGDVVRQPLGCGGRHHYVMPAATREQSLTCTVCGHRTALPYDQESGVA